MANKNFAGKLTFKFLSIFILSLFVIASATFAKSADDYLHGAGAKYIQSRLQEATIEVEEGLAKYPSDTRLKSLDDQLKKLKDQNKKDQGGQGSQNNDDKNQDKDKKDQDKKDSTGQGKDSQDKKDQNKKDQEKKNQEKKDQDKKDQDKDNKDKENQPNKADEKKDKGDSTGSGAAQKPVKPGELSKEEAERLLNSYQDDEKKEHQQMKRPAQSADVEKDW